VYYFAYGSNLSRKQMSERCPEARPRFVAVLPNYRVVFSGWSRKWHGGVAAIMSSRGEKVRGAIYEVDEACLRKLDRFEGGYGRLPVTVFDEDNEPHEAVTYIKAGQLEESKPSPEYGAIIRQGYKDWGIA
jgi:gamma-glutamylcyclotransferase